MTPFHPSNCGARWILALSTLMLLLCGLTACVGVAGETTGPPEESAAPYVQLRLGEHGDDLPPGVSLVVKNGGLINKGFPAMSADGDRIAVFYFAGHPLVGGYPTLDIYSTASLTLQKRIEIGPRPPPPEYQASNRPEVWAPIEHQLIAVNRILAQGGFRPMPVLFDVAGQAFLEPVVRSGKRTEYVRRDGIGVLVITSLATQEVEFEMPMPTIPVVTGAEDPYNNCSAQGGIHQGWYDPESRLLVLRMIFGGGRDGCELPEKWLLKRL